MKKIIYSLLFLLSFGLLSVPSYGADVRTFNNIQINSLTPNACVYSASNNYLISQVCLNYTFGTNLVQTGTSPNYNISVSGDPIFNSVTSTNYYGTNINVSGYVVADNGNGSSIGFNVGNGTAAEHPQAFVSTLGPTVSPSNVSIGPDSTKTNQGINGTCLNIGQYAMNTLMQELVALDCNGNIAFTGNSYQANVYTSTNGSVYTDNIYAGTSGLASDNGSDGGGALSVGNSTGIGPQRSYLLSSTNSNNAINGIMGDVFAISDGNGSYAIAAFDHLGNASFYNDVYGKIYHGTTAQLSNLSASSSVCTDSSKNLTTSGCLSGSISSISGTTNEITASTTSGATTLSIPSNFVAPGTITSTGNATVGGTLIAGSSSADSLHIYSNGCGTANFNTSSSGGDDGIFPTLFGIACSSGSSQYLSFDMNANMAIAGGYYTGAGNSAIDYAWFSNSGNNVTAITSNTSTTIGTIVGTSLALAQYSPAHVYQSTALTVDMSGNLGIAGSLHQASQRKLKNNIKNYSDIQALSVIENTKIVQYCYKAEKCKVGQENHLGFIADDTSTVIAPEHKAMDVSSVASLAIQGVQIEDKRIAKLEKELKESNNKLVVYQNHGWLYNFVHWIW